MALLSALTLENFRSFRERTTFELAPLTILTGPNSSGKSSILKALLFLRHNARNGRLVEPSFSGSEHKLGSFDRALSHASEDQCITFDVGLNTTSELHSLEEEMAFIKDGTTPSMATVTLPARRSSFRLMYGRGLNVYQRGAEIATVEGRDQFFSSIDPESEGVRLLQFAISEGDPGRERPIFSLWTDVEFTEDTTGFDLVELDRIDVMTLYGGHFFESPDDAYRTLDFPEVRDEDAEAAARLLATTLRFYLPSKVYSDFPSKLEKLVEDVCAPEYWERLESDGQAVDAFHNSFFRQALREFVSPRLLRRAEILSRELGRLDHIGTHRASPQRLYSDDEASPFAGLLRAYSRRSLNRKTQTKQFRRTTELQRLLSAFGVGDGLRVERVADAAYVVRVERGEHLVNLADLGYGYSQLVPLIMYAAAQHDADFSSRLTSRNVLPVLLIEEPEANLHPNLQAKLADLFATMLWPEESHTVVETHSEYIIRRLQYLVAKGEVEPKRVAIYYLGPDPESEDYVRRIEIDEHGRLNQDFGPGFTDEATNLMVALYKHGRQN